MTKRDLSGISRRDFLKISQRFGMSSTMLALGGLTGAITLPQLARAAESTYDKRFAKEARHTLRYGAAGFNLRNLMIERNGILEFVRDLEERTDGEVRIEFIGDNQICGQLDCVSKTQEGIVDLFSASTQNSAGGAPFLNVLDYAFMFPSRAAQYHFFYHPDSNKILREPYERMHGIKFLFTHCELRGHHAGQYLARQTHCHERHRDRGHPQPRDGHAAGPHRDGTDAAQPDADRVGRDA
jgi:TRAP-type transport system periplasmic protein